MSIGPPRVVHIVQHLKAGGAEVLVRSLAKGLRSAGVDARFISIYPDKLDDAERRDLGVPLVTIGRRSRTDLGFFGRLRLALRAERPDIVHAHVIAGKYAGRTAAILEGVPSIVFTEHGDDPPTKLEYAVGRVLDSRTHRFVTFSPEHRNRLAHDWKIALEKIVVIPNGVDVPPPGERNDIRNELGIDPSTFALYLPARFVPRKNQELAIRALAELGSGFEHWLLVLAGTGDDEPAMRSLVVELGLTERVRFLGFRTDAPRLLRGMDAFLIPSLREGMPLGLGEAMRAGVPSVSTPWVGFDDFCSDGDTCIVAADFSVAGFASALRRLADDGVRAGIAARGKVHADWRFSMDACVRSHVELYEGLLASAAPGTKR